MKIKYFKNKTKFVIILLCFGISVNNLCAQSCPTGAICYSPQTGGDEIHIFFPSGTQVFPDKVVITEPNGTPFTLTNPYTNSSSSPYQIYPNFPSCTNSSLAAQDYNIKFEVDGVIFDCEIVNGYAPPPPSYDPECPINSSCNNLYFPNSYFPSGNGATFYFPNSPQKDGYYNKSFFDSNTLAYQGLPCDDNFTVVFNSGQTCVIENGVLCETCAPYFGPDCSVIFEECGEDIIQYVESNYRSGCQVWEGDCNINTDLFRTGSVAIGTDKQAKGYNLTVKGGILTEQFKICNTSSNSIEWCDYVFEKDYNLFSLKEVEEHIKSNGYLHKTPSAKEIEKEGGFDLLDVTLNQQEKIEEIFLHLIELDKQVKEIESELK